MMRYLLLVLALIPMGCGGKVSSPPATPPAVTAPTVAAASGCPDNLGDTAQVIVEDANGCLVFMPKTGDWLAFTDAPTSLEDYREKKAALSSEVRQLLDPCKLIWGLGPGIKEEAIQKDFWTDGCPLPTPPRGGS